MTYGLVEEREYERFWQELAELHPGDRYISLHKLRYYELFDHVAYLTRGKERPRVVEVGISAFTRLYKKLFPHLEFVTVDRPLTLHGAAPAFGLTECDATHHYGIDLNKEAIGPAWGDPPLGRFDLVVFCEVLEHLTVNPVQLFEELLSLLKPDGYLYVTTPNFFSMFRLQQIARRENPQEVFPRRGADKAASYHFREFAMGELVRFLEQAGGRVIKADFSGSQDDERTRESLAAYPELRSNLLLVAVRGESNAPVEFISEYIIGARDNDGLPADNSANEAALKVEIRRLQALVAGYEQGRFIRLMKWLKER